MADVQSTIGIDYHRDANSHRGSVVDLTFGNLLLGSILYAASIGNSTVFLPLIVLLAWFGMGAINFQAAQWCRVLNAIGFGLMVPAISGLILVWTMGML